MKLQQTKSGQLFLNVPKVVANSKGWVKGSDLDFILSKTGEWIITEK